MRIATISLVGEDEAMLNWGRESWENLSAAANLGSCAISTKGNWRQKEQM